MASYSGSTALTAGSTPPSKQHRLERVTRLLAKRMVDRTKAAAREFSGNQEPPFSTKLTEQEQIEIYLALDQQGWQKMFQEQGAAEVEKYSNAMLLLMKKHGYSVEPTMVEGPADKMRSMEGMKDPAAMIAAAMKKLPGGQQPAIPAMPGQPVGPAAPMSPQGPIPPAQPMG